MKCQNEAKSFNSICMIFSQAGSGFTPLGSGFWGVRKKSIFLVTCYHLFQDSNNPNYYVLPSITKNISSQDLIQLPDPYNSPGLQSGETYDVIVFYFPEFSEEQIKNMGIIPMNLDEVIFASTLEIGKNLMARGFTGSYLDNHSEKCLSTENGLRPWGTPGSFEKYSIIPEKVEGCDKVILEYCYMKSALAKSASGLSGGVVQAFPEGKVTGICSAEKRGYLLFADIKRVIEIIEGSNTSR